MKLLNNWLRADTAENEETQIEEVQAGDMFTSKEHYLEFTAAFKAWAKAKKPLDTQHFLLYAILRSRDWTKGFTLPENPGKLIEHRYKKSAAFNSIKSPYSQDYLLAPFDGTITTEMLARVRDELDNIKAQGDK